MRLSGSKRLSMRLYLSILGFLCLFFLFSFSLLWGQSGEGTEEVMGTENKAQKKLAENLKKEEKIMPQKSKQKNLSEKDLSKLSKSRQQKINQFFDDLSYEAIDLVDEFYSKDAKFVDPLNEHNGVKAIKDYYANLYQNVDEISFTLKEQVVTGDTHVLPWTMDLKTSAINNGKTILVEGLSLLKFNAEGKVFYHRDYFDMGEFVYEKIPVLKSIIFYIKKRMQGK